MKKLIEYGNIIFNIVIKIFGVGAFILGLISLFSNEDVIVTTTFKPLWLIIFGIWLACGEVKFGTHFK
ncbi:MAG: hypothetical protein ACRC28_18570 [Clostridium sp.]|uniref:hypothetical protein n=1 Tax=Clostridium sp. TaxID=1506 RepID=UPI003F3A008E